MLTCVNACVVNLKCFIGISVWREYKTLLTNNNNAHAHRYWLIILFIFSFMALRTVVISWADAIFLVATHLYETIGAKNERDDTRHMLFAQLVLTVLAVELY